MLFSIDRLDSAANNETTPVMTIIQKEIWSTPTKYSMLNDRIHTIRVMNCSSVVVLSKLYQRPRQEQQVEDDRAQADHLNELLLRRRDQRDHQRGHDGREDQGIEVEATRLHVAALLPPPLGRINNKSRTDFCA